MELWCEDEARLGLKPVARRVRALKGTRPTRCGRQRFESPYAYGFARPATGRNLCLLLPKANAERMGEALANRDFDHLVGLAGKLRRRCNWLADHPDVVKGAVGFHWAVNL